MVQASGTVIKTISEAPTVVAPSLQSLSVRSMNVLGFPVHPNQSVGDHNQIALMVVIIGICGRMHLYLSNTLFAVEYYIGHQHT